MRRVTKVAEAARAIRIELKEQFMGSSVNVHWTDGPEVESVRDIIDKYQYGDFNSQTDGYEYRNRPENLPTARYVFANRTRSEEIQK